jgi:hypothetical protein
MWLLRIVEDIFENMNWSRLDLPVPLIQIDWQKIEKARFLLRSPQHDNQSTENDIILDQKDAWIDENKIICHQCGGKVSLDGPSESHFYGTTEELSRVLSCFGSIRSNCCKERYIVCRLCKTCRLYEDSPCVELHLLGCRQRASEASEGMEDLEADTRSLLCFKLGIHGKSWAGDGESRGGAGRVSGEVCLPFKLPTNPF